MWGGGGGCTPLRFPDLGNLYRFYSSWFANMNTLSKIPFLIFTEIFYEFSPKFPKIPSKLKKKKFFAPKFFAINVCKISIRND